MLTVSKVSRTMMRQRDLIRSKKSEGESKGWERAADGQKDVNPLRSSRTTVRQKTDDYKGH